MSRQTRNRHSRICQNHFIARRKIQDVQKRVGIRSQRIRKNQLQNQAHLQRIIVTPFRRFRTQTQTRYGNLNLDLYEHRLLFATCSLRTQKTWTINHQRKRYHRKQNRNQLKTSFQNHFSELTQRLQPHDLRTIRRKPRRIHLTRNRQTQIQKLRSRKSCRRLNLNHFIIPPRPPRRRSKRWLNQKNQKILLLVLLLSLIKRHLKLLKRHEIQSLW